MFKGLPQGSNLIALGFSFTNLFEIRFQLLPFIGNILRFGTFLLVIFLIEIVFAYDVFIVEHLVVAHLFKLFDFF